MKPSKKVTGIMIIILALTSAFIVSDKLKESEKNEETTVVEGEIESANPVKSIEEYMIDKIAEEKSDIFSTSTPKTVTEFAFNELFGNYAKLKQNSEDTLEKIDELTTIIAAKTKEYSTIPDKYFIFNIKTFPDYETNKIKEYGNRFGEITLKYYKERLLINEISSEMYIKRYSENYSDYAEELSKIEVPRSISDEHLNFINNLSKIGVSVIKISEIEKDPLLAHLVLNQYNEVRLQQTEILITISDYFINNDIIFSDTEHGAMWNNI